MSGPSSRGDWLKLALVLARSAAARRLPHAASRLFRRAMLDLAAVLCAIAALACAVVAIGIACAPPLGAAGVILVDAGPLPAIGVAALVLDRPRSPAPPATRAPEALAAEVTELPKQQKAPSPAVGLLLGMFLAASGPEPSSRAVTRQQ